MDTFLTSVVATLVAAALVTVPRLIAKRHFLLMALSNDIELQREQLRFIQQTIQLVATNFEFQGPVVIPEAHSRRDRATFTALLAQAAFYAPAIHLSVVAFDARVQDIHSLFDHFKASLAAGARENVDPAALAAYHEAVGVRMFGLCEAVLKSTQGRELATYPDSYGDALANVRAEELLNKVYSFHAVDGAHRRQTLLSNLVNPRAKRLSSVIDVPAEVDRELP